MAPCYRNLKARGGFFCSSGGIQGRKKEAEKPWKSSLFPRNAWNPSPRCTPASVPTHAQKHVREGGGLDGWGGLQDLPASLRCFYTLCRCGQVQVGGGNVLCAFCVYNCLFYVCVFEQGGRGDPGLPGLPGPAGYRGQKGDRVRDTQRHMMSADVWRSTVVISWCHLI